LPLPFFTANGFGCHLLLSVIHNPFFMVDFFLLITNTSTSPGASGGDLESSFPPSFGTTVCVTSSTGAFSYIFFGRKCPFSQLCFFRFSPTPPTRDFPRFFPNLEVTFSFPSLTQQWSPRPFAPTSPIGEPLPTPKPLSVFLPEYPKGFLVAVESPQILT